MELGQEVEVRYGKILREEDSIVNDSTGSKKVKELSIFDLERLFPDEISAIEWVEEARWGSEDRPCPRCGSCGTYRIESGVPMAFRCRDCKRYFSVMTGTVMERSHIPVRKWVYGIYMWMTAAKGISSIKLAKDLGIAQSSAWYMIQRLREAFASRGGSFLGPVEVDETFMGGRRRNMHYDRILALGLDRQYGGANHMQPVAGIRDRATGHVDAEVIPDTTSETLIPFIEDRVDYDTMVYTDGNTSYARLPNREFVRHSRHEYVVGDVHTNGIESFWAIVKRAQMGIYHHISRKHLQRYLWEFCGRNNLRGLGVLEKMVKVVRGMDGRRLTYRELTAG